jgi:hypothetical protein
VHFSKLGANTFSVVGLELHRSHPEPTPHSNAWAAISARETAVAPSNCRSRLCVQHLDGNCTRARADAGGCGSRNASPHAEVMAGRKLAPRRRANGAGRNQTGYSRTLATILAEVASNIGAEDCSPTRRSRTWYPRRSRLIFQVDVFPAHGRAPTNLAEVTERDRDIRYSSRTRLITNNLREKHNVRHAINEVHKLLPPELPITE